MDVQELLKSVESVLVIDWPAKEIPDLLALAGLRVVVHGGAGPEDYSAYEARDGEVVVRRTGRPPERADLIYSYRPLSELPAILAAAKGLQTRTMWTQSGWSAVGVKDPKGCWVPEDELELAQNLVRSAGLNHVTEPYIGDVAREIIKSR